METITELVAQHRRGRTNIELAEAGGIGLRAVQSWAARKGPDPSELPEVKTIRGLAAALGVSESRVLFAMATSIGIDTSQDMLVLGAGSLPADGQDGIRSVAALLVGKHEDERA